MIKINIYISITVILISLITYYYYIFNNSHHKEPFLSYRDFLNRKCFTPKITLNERKAFLRLINITNNILKKHNIDWIPIGGNLISVYRYGTLILPWDDDFDFVVRKKYINKAITVLKNELPKYKCKIIALKKWKATNSILYKIFSLKNYYTPNHKVYRNNRIFNWPFLDLFVDSDDEYTSRNNENIYIFRSTNMAQDLTYNEYPLITLNCDGLDIKVPSRGFRSYDFIKKKNTLDICYDDDFIHKYDINVKCNGFRKIRCRNVKKIKKKSEIFSNKEKIL